MVRMAALQQAQRKRAAQTQLIPLPTCEVERERLPEATPSRPLRLNSVTFATNPNPKYLRHLKHSDSPLQPDPGGPRICRLLSPLPDCVSIGRFTAQLSQAIILVDNLT